MKKLFMVLLLIGVVTPLLYAQPVGKDSFREKLLEQSAAYQKQKREHPEQLEQQRAQRQEQVKKEQTRRQEVLSKDFRDKMLNRLREFDKDSAAKKALSAEAAAMPVELSIVRALLSGKTPSQEQYQALDEELNGLSAKQRQEAEEELNRFEAYVQKNKIYLNEEAQEVLESTPELVMVLERQPQFIQTLSIATGSYAMEQEAGILRNPAILLLILNYPQDTFDWLSVTKTWIYLRAWGK